MPEKKLRISIEIDSDALKFIDWLAEYYGETSEGVIKRSIATEAYITKKIQDGYTILAIKEGEELKEIRFSGASSSS